MITIDNYFNKTGSFDLKSLPEALKKGHEFVLKATNNGASWVPADSGLTNKST